MREGLTTCSSPLCDVQFEQTGIMRLEPRKFCSAECRQDAWILRRAKALLDKVGIIKFHTILDEVKNEPANTGVQG